MLCFYNKWRISKALDSNQDIPGRIKHHLEICESCRHFWQSSSQLSENKEMLELVPNSNRLDNLNQRIKLACKPNYQSRRLSHRFQHIPLLATSLLMVIVLAMILFHYIPGDTRSVNQEMMVQKFSSNFNQFRLDRLLSKVENPFEKELSGLGETVKSTGQFLLSCLDFGLKGHPN